MTDRILTLRRVLALVCVGSLGVLQFIVVGTSASAAVASPTRVSVVSGELRVIASPGRSSGLDIFPPVGSPDKVLIRSRLGSGEFEANAPCVVNSAFEAECPRAAVSRLRVDAGDGDDGVASTLNVPGVITLGSGNDGLVLGGVTSQTAVDLGPGNDGVSAGTGEASIVGGPGVDSVDYSGSFSPVVVRLDDLPNDGRPGSKDNVHSDVENVMGGRAADILVGSNASNVIFGGQGNDRIEGGAGDDRFVEDDGVADGISGDDVMVGGPGVDTMDSSDHVSDLKVSLDNTSNDGALGESDNVHSDVENVLTGTGDDTLIGTSANNVLRSGAGHDILSGRSGNDLLDGGEDGGSLQRSDWLSGGSGTDTVTYSSRQGGVVVDMDDVDDDGAPGERDNVLADVENLLGSAGNDTLIGNSAANILRGLGGNDTLNGVGGNDALEGGVGRDVLFGGAGVDTATYQTHPVGVAVTLDDKANDGRPNEGDNVRSDVENVTGSNHPDTIVGSSLANVLRGAAGNDRLFGRAGDDRLIGDSGRDQGFGDSGRDTCTTETRVSCP